LLRTIVTDANTIRVLQIKTSNDESITQILELYPTLCRVEGLDVLLPDAFTILRPGQTVLSNTWFPNVIQRHIFQTLTSLAPTRYAALTEVRILNMKGDPLTTEGLTDGFRFGFVRDDEGRIVSTQHVEVRFDAIPVLR
jgi:hypothetical protein